MSRVNSSLTKMSSQLDGLLRNRVAFSALEFLGHLNTLSGGVAVEIRALCTKEVCRLTERQLMSTSLDSFMSASSNSLSAGELAVLERYDSLARPFRALIGAIAAQATPLAESQTEIFLTAENVIGKEQRDSMYEFVYGSILKGHEPDMEGFHAFCRVAFS